jgi:virginiamycin B lyase
MQSSFIEEISEVMSQQQPPSPRRESSLGLWIGLILLLTSITLGIWGAVTKPDIIVSLIAFGLILFALLLGIVQVIPKSLIWIQQSIKMGLFVTGIVLLLGSLVLNLIVLLGPQPHTRVGLNTSPTSGSKPTETSTLTGTPSSVPSTTGHLSEFPIPTDSSNTTGITQGPDGNLWFIEEHGNKIGRITPQGVITEFPIPTPNSISDGIMRGPDGNLWFFENKGDKIGRITPQGQITEFTVQAGSDLVGLTAGPDGNLWFVGYQPNKIWKMTTSGVITGQFPILTAGSGTETIIAGSDGNVWFVEDWGNKIGRITPQGQITEFPIPTPLVPGQQNYHDATLGPDGNVWFTEGLANKIGRITPQGEITEFSVPPPGGFPGSPCVGPDGKIWFTDDAKHIRRLDSSGMFLGEFTVIPIPENRPAGLTVGPDKNIWFIDRKGNQIGRITTGP